VKSLSKILITVALSSSFALAGLVDGISVVINKEPITLYEIYKYSEHFKIDKKQALDVLVRQKLEDAQIKKLGIDADMFEIDDYIAKLAKQNNMSQFDFLQTLRDQKVNIDDYRKDIKTKIKRDKLYNKIIQEKVGEISEEDLENFYKTNKEKFVYAQTYQVKLFSSTNEASLQAIQKNPMLRPLDVNIQDEELINAKLNPNLQAILAQTPVNNYTQILPVNEQYTMFYIVSKKDLSYLAFDQIKNNLYGIVYKQKEKEALNDYFEKLKSSANIVVLRNPN
jgi:parvulin-like peptidyl-prolyl isomerase